MRLRTDPAKHVEGPDATPRRGPACPPAAN
jgi:hypothetical protein